MSTDIDKPADPKTRWTTGTSIDGKRTFSFVHAEPHGHEPMLGMAKIPEVYAQKEQINPMDEAEMLGKETIDKAKDPFKKVYEVEPYQPHTFHFILGMAKVSMSLAIIALIPFRVIERGEYMQP